MPNSQRGAEPQPVGTGKLQLMSTPLAVVALVGGALGFLILVRAGFGSSVVKYNS